ncbi:MAG: TonB-dependent receptor [Proteobacteria bacterium]|nr:TonB-dependent receptor [Pseudomonadota bacterium]
MTLRSYRGFSEGLQQVLIKAAKFLAAATLLASIAFHSAVFAQDNLGDESTIVYPAIYFAEYAPVTALDMVNRIPGMNIRNNAAGSSSRGALRGGRGLGSGGRGTQVLVNGKRVAGKNNNTQAMLARITAEQVAEIRLIRGTSGDLDVRGSTQIVDIILYDELSDSSLSVEINTSVYADNRSEPGGSASYSGKSGNLDYLLSAIAEPRYEHMVSREHSILADFLPNDRILENRVREQTQYTLSTNLGYEINANSSARFNALYSQNDNPTKVSRRTIDLRNPGSSPFDEREFIPGEQSNWEIGGDYEYKFANGNRAKLLFITNETDTVSTRERFVVDASGEETKNLFLDAASILQERILRGSYTMKLFEQQSVEFGLERAQTILESDLRLGLALDSGTASAAYGGLVPVTVSNANTRVEEIRYEPFAIHNWRLNSRMSLETSLIYETSEIEQVGDFTNTRNFEFFKPKLDFRFDITPQLQLRFLLDKFVRQINFSDFVAATDSEDNDSNTQAGNTELRPDFWWNYNFTAEYRLPDDVGVVSANIYKHRHKDFLQRIDVSPTEDELRSANGNIGTGEMWVLDVKASIRLKMFNLPNVLVTSRASVRTSEVNGPLLGEERSFNNFNRGRFDLGFRHDVPQWRMNWGINMTNNFDGGTKRWDIDDIESFYADPLLTAFLEVIAFDDITFRFDVQNVTEIDDCRDRTRFVGRVRDQILEEIEFNCRGSGRVLALKVSGTF